MTEVQDSWRDVMSKTEALGQKLKLHLDREDQEASESEDGKPSATRAALEDLGHRLQDALESFGSAAKDPAVRTDVKDIGVALKDALVNTLTKVGGDVGDAVKKVRDRDAEAGESAEADSADDGGGDSAPGGSEPATGGSEDDRP